ncbi:MAG: cysteine desulfurase CsdA [Legionellales bacterium]|nr:cysteine desulfurase CsdA [Legionellales bacterium]OUX65830.1 MAG: aminotransferase [Gammaproteobacteria bacterium TMED281]|tara:strand:+ start:1456 stop:2688 length:1233 start_codon:yes stop_codon:yes gene_type:complete
MSISKTFDHEKIASDFPILSRRINENQLVYLDNAATTQKPLMVLDTLKEFYSRHNANVHRGVYLLSEEATAAYENARVTIQHFINAHNEREIIFLRGVTEAINLVASSIGFIFEPGDEILISEMEHHANIVPWQLLAKKLQLKIKVVPLTQDGNLDMDAFNAMLTSKVKMISITYASNVLGTINDVKTIIDKGHAMGSKVLIDAAQAPAHFKIDVQVLNCDFLTFSGHKHFGPTGIGILYGKEELLSAMPPYQGGGSMIEKVSYQDATYLPPPLKFEAGTPAYAEAVGMAASLDYINSFGIEKIKEYEDQLTDYAYKALSNIDYVKLYGPAHNRLGIFSFAVKGAHPHDVATILDSQGVAVRAGHHCAMPLMDVLGEPALIRASIAMYNGTSDIDHLVDGLNQVKKIFRL